MMASNREDNKCDICHVADPTRFAGQIKVCDKCGDEIEAAVAGVLQEAGVFDPSSKPAIPVPRNSRHYRVSPEVLLVAELRAQEACRRTGKPVMWTDVIRYVLRRALLPQAQSGRA